MAGCPGGTLDPAGEKDYRLAEFRTLREEILQSQSRAYTTLLAGITGIPAAQSLAQAIEFAPLLYVLPLVVLVMALMYQSQRLSVIRMGEYIREKIEKDTHGVLEWEHWVDGELPNQKRRLRYGEEFLNQSFYLLFAVYYAGSTILAVSCALGNKLSLNSEACTVGRALTAAGILGLYVALGICAGFYFAQRTNGLHVNENPDPSRVVSSRS